MPALESEGAREFAAAYEVVWKGARFGIEQLVVERSAGGARVIRARSYDGQFGQRSSLRIVASAAAQGERLVLESDGSQGRDKIELTREEGRARLRGTLLSGPGVDKEEALSAGALLGVGKFLASWVLLGQRLVALPVGQELSIEMRQLSLGSSAELSEEPCRIVRSPDTTLAFRGAQIPARRYAITPPKGPKSTLWLDQAGWPIGFELEAYGSAVQFKRLE
jgi:hypothetical protein